MILTRILIVCDGRGWGVKAKGPGQNQVFEVQFGIQGPERSSCKDPEQQLLPYWGYIGFRGLGFGVRVIIRHNGKENGNYYNGLYRGF